MDEPGYLLHLSDADLRLLAAIGAETGRGEHTVAELRRQPQLVEELLGHPRLAAALFAAEEPSDVLLHASPFLVFACAVQRCVADLRTVSAVPERIGVREQVVVFDVEDLRGFLASPRRRLFLAELLASYTRVASGSIWVQSGRRWRRRRFSELDVLQLASLLDVVSDLERPVVYRRLGDLALFLTGVFSDYVASHPLGNIDADRLLGTVRMSPTEAAEAATLRPAVAFLEQLGQRWYRLAASLGGSLGGLDTHLVDDVARHFSEARRILGYLTDRYLLPSRHRWFPAPGG